jgi:hypothetical protein
VCITPFGNPVVPEVKMIMDRSSGFAGLSNSAFSSRAIPENFSRGSEVTRPVVFPRAWDTTSWYFDDTQTYEASEASTMYRRLSPMSMLLMGTQIAPIFVIAIIV